MKNENTKEKEWILGGIIFQIPFAGSFRKRSTNVIKTNAFDKHKFEE